MKRCSECSTTRGEIFNIAPFYTAWGRNCFDFQWARHEEKRMLCRECFENRFHICDKCGMSVEADYWSHGVPEDYDDSPLCPECVKKMFPAQGETK